MKQKLKKITRIILLFCTALLSTNCTNDESIDNKLTGQSANINEARNWFEQYTSTKKVNSLFEKQTYNWEQAKVEKLENGLEAITVPASNSFGNEEYTGRRLLYLYAKENEIGFETTLYDLITKKDDSELDSFDGFVIAWNLETGFVNALEFENNKSINSIIVKDYLNKDFKTDNSTGKAPAPLPIKLDEIFVGGGNNNSTIKDFSIGLVSNGNSGGGSLGGYTDAPHGAGGGGSGIGISGISSFKSEAEFIAAIESTNSNAFNFDLIQNGNTVTATAIIGVVPFANISLEITEAKVGDKYVVNNVVTSLTGITTGLGWSQTTYNQTTSGNITTVNFNGLMSVVLPIDGLGTLYSSLRSYSIKIDNTNGKIISGVRTQ